MFDLVIENGLICDGSGDKAYHADIGIKDGLVVKIGNTIKGQAKEKINAENCIVSPGFIDAHTHDDIVFFEDPYNMAKLMQGVTTVVTGNCGFGSFPANKPTVDMLISYAEPILGGNTAKCTFKDFGEYAKALDSTPKGQNAAALIPHGPVYIALNGFSKQKLTEKQLIEAKKYIENGMYNGALGLSVGFMYAPGCYCNRTELSNLNDVVAKYNGIFCVHMRSESEFISDSIKDVLKISSKTGVPVHISHFKNIGKKFWGDMPKLIEWIENLIETGTDLTFDMYPYTMGSTTMSILFPDEILEGGIEQCLKKIKDVTIRKYVKKRLNEYWKDSDNLSLLCGWDNVIIASVKTKENEKLIGLSIEQISRIRGVDNAEAFMRLFEEEDGRVTILLNHISVEDMEDTLLSKYCMLISDGIPGGKLPHPRLYGSFPRFIKRFTRDKKMLSVEEAIRKMTSFPAKRFKLGNRGLIKEGYLSDIVVFDHNIITDTAQYDKPFNYPIGINYVIVNGQIVIDQGEVTGKKPGRFIRRSAL